MAQQSQTENQQPDYAEPLTGRELEILRFLSDGWTNNKIAEQLVLSLDTVKWYNKRIYSKLYVKNRTQAVRQARAWGVLSDGDEQKPTAPLPPRHNLPAATTPFVGRKADIASQADLLSHETIRLITILAVGGMGKTRLVLEVAKTQLAHFSDGIYFLPLAQLRTADNIVPTLAAYLKIQLSTTADPLTQLTQAIGQKKILLILDNFEHLLDGADIITTLLQDAPQVKIIVTSRERLNLRGETVYTLSGMSLPVTETPAEILTCSAVQLFIQRVQLLRPQEPITNDELLHIRRICHQVGGMPLGIELAASLMDILSAEEIVAEITQGFDVLETEMRDMPARLRSIRAVLDYSWGRLTNKERDIYMRLTVFPAGFTREAAKEVAGANLQVLKTLTHKSLLQRESAAERYVIHELLRQYAEEKLADAGQTAEAHNAHARYFMTLAAKCWPQLQGKAQLVTLNQIDREFENIRAAWSWSVTHTDADAINQAIEPLYWFCDMRARVPTGEKLFQQARDQFGLSFSLEAHSVQRRLVLRFNPVGKPYQTQVEQALAIAQQLNKPNEVAFLSWALGYGRFFSGNFEEAIPVLENAVTQFQTLGNDFYLAESMHWLGVCHRFLGQPDKANSYAQQIHTISEQAGNLFALARILGSSGIYEVLAGTAEAEVKIQQAIAIRSELGSQAGIAISVVGLGLDAFLQGDFAESRTLANDALIRSTDSNSPFPKAVALGLLGLLAAVDENYDEARQLCTDSVTVSSNPNVPITALLGQAMAACGLEDYTAARQHLYQWLTSGSFLQTSRTFLSALPILAIIYAGEGKIEQAVTLHGLISTQTENTTSWVTQWQLPQKWHGELESQLGVSPYQTAWAHGRTLSRDLVIKAFLAEMD